jgi:vitamin K-dependent gamma-carboxylase
MMLRTTKGVATFHATDPESGRTRTIDRMDHLSVRQVVHVVLYSDMALQFSHSLADSFRAEGYEQIEVRANVMASLNGRESQHLIDPTVDLAAQPRTLAPAPWILPLEKPLPPPP